MQLHIDETLIWDAFFLDFPRPILTLTYEQLSLDPIWITAQVLEHLGLAPSAADKVEVRSERQADDLSLEWEERFIKERRERGEEPSAGVGAPLRTEAGKVQPRKRQRRICLATKEVPGLFRNGGIGTIHRGRPFRDLCGNIIPKCAKD